ncbi:MAG TPA: response regulator transcription factor, partial [Chloroflexota bacterium]
TLLGGRVEPVSGAAIPAARWVGPDSQALDIARAAGDEDDYSRTLESLEQRTLEETRAELAVVRTWTRPTAIMRALGVLGRDLLKQRDGFREAAGLYRELLAIGERYGSIAAQGEALLELAIMQGNFGEFQLAQANARRAQELIARLGPAHELHFQAGGLAVTLAYFMEADWAAMAARLSGFAATLWRARSPRAHLVSACAALCHARAGNFEAAREQLVSLTPVIADIKPDIYVHQVVVLFASTVVWEIGAVELAADYLRLAHTIVDAGFGGNLLPHELTIARMAALNGDMVDARDHFDLAREELDSGGQRASRAIVDYDEALALVRNGSTDRVRILELLDAAESAFAALGMAGWTERAARLKETLQTPAPSCGSRELSSGLTSRETEVLRLLALGRTNREIAEILVLSPKTVEHHVAHLYTKIQVRGRVDAASYALRNGIVGPAEPSST